MVESEAIFVHLHFVTLSRICWECGMSRWNDGRPSTMR
jgi:hypothetical protein